MLSQVGFLQAVCALTVVVMLVYGCTIPAENFRETAASLGLREEVVVGTEFRHVLFWREGSDRPILHVYLGSDGSPYLGGYPAKDPTPRDPLTLRLLALDSGPAVYVGRPCYHGVSAAPECTPDVSTYARYSERVVASLAAVVRRILAIHRYPELVLIGHSGGGILAMLLAERLPETSTVVTIAAPLDIDAWTDYHKARRLTGSLNPTRRPPLGGDVVQIHFAGGNDRTVPPSVVTAGASPTHAKVVVIEDYDHVCCWEQIWPRVLRSLGAGRALPGDDPGGVAG